MDTILSVSVCVCVCEIVKQGAIYPKPAFWGNDKVDMKLLSQWNRVVVYFMCNFLRMGKGF